MFRLSWPNIGLFRPSQPYFDLFSFSRTKLYVLCVSRYIFGVFDFLDQKWVGSTVTTFSRDTKSRTLWKSKSLSSSLGGYQVLWPKWQNEMPKIFFFFAKHRYVSTVWTILKKTTRVQMIDHFLKRVCSKMQQTTATAFFFLNCYSCGWIRAYRNAKAW